MENVDEILFIFDHDNGRTLDVVGSQTVKYAVVVSSGEAITMVMSITGRRKAWIEAHVLIFMNKSHNYPIRGLPNNVLGVCYQTAPKGSIDMHIFATWFDESHCF